MSFIQSSTSCSFWLPHILLDYWGVFHVFFSWLLRNFSRVFRVIIEEFFTCVSRDCWGVFQLCSDFQEWLVNIFFTISNSFMMSSNSFMISSVSPFNSFSCSRWSLLKASLSTITLSSSNLSKFSLFSSQSAPVSLLIISWLLVY